MTYRNPISGYSKAPRGLSVPPRVTGVFTGTTISPSPSPRQRPDRYTIRAGQNLPDKEFRYLRTVIVTAAVYWGFGSKLLRHSSHVVKSRFHATGNTLPQPSPGLVGFLQSSFARYCIFLRKLGLVVDQGPFLTPGAFRTTTFVPFHALPQILRITRIRATLFVFKNIHVIHSLTPDNTR
jgi:hypothetical protein